MHSTKSRGATRRVWRMTAENQLGEILELPDESNAGHNRQGWRSQGRGQSRPRLPGCSMTRQDSLRVALGNHAALYRE